MWCTRSKLEITGAFRSVLPNDLSNCIMVHIHPVHTGNRAEGTTAVDDHDAQARGGGIEESEDADLHISAETVDQAAGRGLGAARNDLLEEEDIEQYELVIHAGYELFVIGFLLVQLGNSALLFMPLRSEQREIVVVFWIGISIFLILDALVRLWRTRKQFGTKFRGFGWLRLVGSMPIPFITGARLIGVAYALRKVRRGEVKEIGNVVISRHAQSTMFLVVFLAIVVFEFGALMILVAEEAAPGANITTAQDAMWWSVVTISTVGYGDTYPITYLGRLIGLILIVTGVGLFTTITSFLAKWFMRPHRRTSRPAQQSVGKPQPSLHASERARLQTPDGPKTQISEIRSLLEDMQATHQSAVSELEQKLAQLEETVIDFQDH